MSVLERLQKLCRERFGDGRATITESARGVFRVVLTAPEDRTGDRAVVFAIGNVTPAAAVAGGQRAAGDAANQVTFSFSSELPVMNWWGQNEILSHHPEDADFTRLAEVGAILRNHNPREISGKPLRVWLDDKTRRGMCVEEFGTTEIAKLTQHEVLVDQTMRGISVGYLVREWVYLEGDGTRYRDISGTKEGLWVAAKWQALEASHTPIPADPSVGVGRAIAGRKAGTTEGEMKVRMKLTAAWNGHKAGETIEVTEQDARAIETANAGTRVQDAATAPAGQPKGSPAPGTRTEPAQPAAPAAPAAAQPADTRATFEQMQQAERLRCKGIRDLCRKHGVDPEPYIDSGASLSDVREQILDILSTRSENRPTGGVRVGADDRSKFLRATSVGLMVRAGATVAPEELRDTGGREFANWSLERHAEESLRRAGLTIPSDRRSMVDAALRGPAIVDFARAGEAITAGTADFPLILANVGHRFMLMGAAEAVTTWRLWAGKGTAADFKAMSLLKLSEAGELGQVAENAAFPLTKFSEQRESVQVLTWGKGYTLSRQAIVNDDLNAFTQIPRALGAAAAYKPNILAVKVLLGNAAMSDGVALFHATHRNYSANANYKLDTIDHARAGLGNLYKVLTTQTAMQHGDLAADIAITPAALPHALLVGPSQTLMAQATVGATSFGTGIDGTNPLNRVIPTLATEPLLENSLVTGYSTTAYYLFANPAIAPVVVVAFLDGNETPFMEEVVNTGLAADGRVFKVRIDAAAAAADFRGAAKENGA